MDPDAIRAFEHTRWEAAAPAYAASFGVATRMFADALLDAAAVRAGTRVLDMACGPGVVAGMAASRGADMCGVDFSAAMLAQARAAFPRVEFVHGDAEALPLPNASFDAVVSNFGLHHVPRPALALAEARRVLRPGGRVAFTFWAGHAENIAWKLVFQAVRRCGDPAASDAPPPGGGFGTTQACLDALAAAGFVDVAARVEHRVWRHADAAALVAALRAGTARMAAMIEGQAAGVLPRVIAEIELAAAGYRDADGLALPIAAVVAEGMREG
ncbi:MAG TPA: methyltransferase domain-containing protein [Acetobacteraceae bacterium]|jgi:SAM-dependent methyltransferase